MKLHRWSDLERTFSPERRRKIDRIVEQERLEMSLAELRKKLGVTQEELADAVEVSQAELSRMERRQNSLLSTLRAYVRGLGGELELVAVVHGERVRLHI